ncbi:MAG: DUF5317 domain-containing protein [Acidimicrobiales bacterium]
MILAVVFALVVATVPVLGGRLSRLAELRIRLGATIAASLVLQTVIISVLPSSLPFAVAATLHLFSYALALVFVKVNWRIVGMPVLVIGGLLNLAAIAANGGVMPARAGALEAAGRASTEGEFINSDVQEGARLALLGDVFAIPEPVPLANVFSVGDVLLVVGGAVVVHRACGSSLRRRRVPSAAQAPTA